MPYRPGSTPRVRAPSASAPASATGGRAGHGESASQLESISHAVYGLYPGTCLDRGNSGFVSLALPHRSLNRHATRPTQPPPTVYRTHHVARAAHGGVGEAALPLHDLARDNQLR